MRVVLDDVSTFIYNINHSLMCGVNRACSFSFPFRTDVFKYLFGGKGRACPHRFGLFYDFDDFNPCFFPPDWCRCYDRLGDGCRVVFPIRMYSKVRWLPASYTKDENWVLACKKRSFTEVCKHVVEFCNHHNNSIFCCNCCALPSIRMAGSNSTCIM